MSTLYPIPLTVCIPDAEAVSVFEGIDKFMLWYCEFSFKNVIISCKISLFPVIINTFITSLISSIIHTN